METLSRAEPLSSPKAFAQTSWRGFSSFENQLNSMKEEKVKALVTGKEMLENQINRKLN